MKRYLRQPRYSASIPTLCIVIEVESQYSDTGGIEIAAAAEYVTTKPRIKEQFILHQEQIDEMNHLIHRVVGLLIKNNFKILDKHQSNESYTYYIRFLPADNSGKFSDTPLQLMIEIRDHINRRHKTEGKLGKNLAVYASYVGDKECFDTDGVIAEVRVICDQLKSGDYSAFLI